MLAPGAIGSVRLDVLGEPVVAGERRREDDAGVVAQGVGQPPSVGELGAERGRLVAHHERDAGVAQRVETGADRQPGGGVECFVAGGLDGELLDDVERGVATGQLHDVGRVVDRLEAGSAARRS